MNILAITYGKNFFEAGNAERARQAAIAGAAGEMHAVVFSSKAENFPAEIVDSHLFLRPTNSTSSIGKVLDAIKIGIEVIQKDPNADWVITAQDPFEAGLVAWRIAQATGKPFNVQEHGDFFSATFWRSERWLNQFRYQLGKFVLRQARTIRVVSARTKKTLCKLGIPETRIFVLPVRTDVAAFTRAVADHGLIPDYDPKKVYLLSAARFVSQKNLSLLLRAFGVVVRHHPELHVLLVGRGALAAELQTIAQSQAPGHVTFMEWTDDMPALMKAVDGYVLSSNYEGWGRVLIEAQAAGLPIVTTDVGCVHEAVPVSEACRVVPVHDEPALSAALETLAKELPAAKRAAQAIASTLTSPPTDQAYSEAWTAVLQRTISDAV